MFKNIKKIGVLFILLMFCFSVTAENLNKFPEQFLKNDKFDGKIVLGAVGSPRDYLSAVEVGIGLQYNLVNTNQASQEVEVNDDEEEEEALDVLQIRKGTNFLESVEPLSVVFPIVTGDDFSLLESGQFRNKLGTYDYKQFITFGPSGTLNYGHQTEVPEDEEEIPVTSLQFEAGADVYEYKLSFSKSVKTEIGLATDGYNLKDLEGKSLTILGNEYSVFSTEHTAKDSISITLLGGSQEDMITGLNSKTYTVNGKEYEVEVVGVYTRNDEAKVVFNVNGERTKDLAVGDTYAFEEGVEIAVSELLQSTGPDNENADVVVFLLGAQKITLTDTNISDDNYNANPYKVAEKEVKDTYVKIKGSDDGLVAGGELKIDEIYVKFTPSKKHFVEPGKGLADIVTNKNQLFTGSFDLFYNSYKEEGNDMETLDLVYEQDDEYILEFTNKLDQHLQIPLFYVDSGAIARFGGEDYALIVEENVNISKGMFFIVTSDGSNRMPNAKGVTHYIKYLGLDADTNTIKFKDMGRDLEMSITYKDGETTKNLLLNNVFYEFTFSDVEDSDILVDLDNDGSITTGEKPTIVTKYGLNIDLETSSYKTFTISTPKKQSSVAGDTLNGALYYQVGPGVQAYFNTTYGMGISSNPVLETSAINEFHDAVRITVKVDGEQIDIDQIERCIDGMHPQQITDVVTTMYDNSSLGINLGEAVLSSFLGDVCYPTFTTTNKFLWNVGESNVETGSTSYGQLIQVTKDKDKPDLFSMISAKNQLEHMVYLKSVSSDIKTSVVATTPTENKLAINAKIPSAVLDADLTDKKENMILVGGPCVNKLSRELLGNPSKCVEGFEEGKGRIKFVKKDGFNYVIVAGYSGEDTFRAAKVLGDFNVHEFGYDDLEVTGTLTNPVISQYVEPVKTEKEEIETAPEKPTPKPEENKVVEEKLNCPGTASEEIAYDVKIKKFGVTKDVSTKAGITVDGLEATIEFPGTEPFKAQMGVDWLQYTMHIHRDDCNGDKVGSLVFKWEDGDLSKTETITLPEKGCYCAKVTAEDLDIDSASIEMVGATEAIANFATE
jgi:hypothetical protein